MARLLALALLVAAWPQDPKNPVRAAAVSGDGRIAVAMYGEQNKVRVYSTKDSKTLAEWNELCFALAVSPDGKFVACATSDLRFYDAAAGQETVLVEGSQAHMTSVAWASGKPLLVVGAKDGLVRVVDAKRQKQAFGIQSMATVTTVEISKDGKLIAAAGLGSAKPTDLLVKIHDAASGGTLHSIPETRKVKALAFSPDGKTLAYGAGEEIRLVGTADGKEQGVIRGQPDEIRALQWAPEGKLLYAASKDGTVRAWGMPGGQNLCSWRAHPGVITQMALTTDGKTISTAGEDGRFVLWQAATGKELISLK